MVSVGCLGLAVSLPLNRTASWCIIYQLNQNSVLSRGNGQVATASCSVVECLRQTIRISQPTMGQVCLGAGQPRWYWPLCSAGHRCNTITEHHLEGVSLCLQPHLN